MNQRMELPFVGTVSYLIVKAFLVFFSVTFEADITFFYQTKSDLGEKSDF